MVLGVDNMFVLTSAVTSTSINMPVKERTAEGLARCGISIFLNLVAELCFLWGIYVFIPTRVIREMVVFNAVALVMDFCMQMTYFLTVLSVDMQRMELADFITQGSRTPSSLRLDAKKKRSALHVPPLAESMLRSFRERKARTYTAVLVSGQPDAAVLVADTWPDIRVFAGRSFSPIGSCICFTGETISSRRFVPTSTSPKRQTPSRGDLRPPLRRQARSSGICLAPVHPKQSTCTSSRRLSSFSVWTTLCDHPAATSQRDRYML